MKMTATEIWNKIVELHNQNLSHTEATIQNLWESVFTELFGYRKLLGEIERHRQIRIGSTERVITDIIIRSGDTDLFVVELKQHNMQITDGMVQQLLSYLRQLRLDVGILVCNKICLINYDHNKSDEEQNKTEIAFKKDNPAGIRFVELFSKGAFSKAAVVEFIEQQNAEIKNTAQIKRELTSDLVIDLLREHFTSKFSETEFEQAIKTFNIKVWPKGAVPPPGPNPPPPPLKRDSINKNEAIQLCFANGLDVRGSITFASENAGVNKYWANPPINCLTNDWWILLNDITKKQLHIIMLPANTLSQQQVRFKNNKYMDIQIYYNDPTFEDSRSKIKFSSWLIKSISY